MYPGSWVRERAGARRKMEQEERSSVRAGERTERRGKERETMLRGEFMYLSDDGGRDEVILLEHASRSWHQPLMGLGKGAKIEILGLVPALRSSRAHCPLGFGAGTRRRTGIQM